MANINLLPWRDELKEQRKKTFIVISVISGLLGAILVFLTWMYFEHQLSDQRNANQLITNTNTELDKQLKSLDGLQERRKAIVERMKLIQDLQGQRPITVRLIDELVRVMPKEVYLTEFSREGNKFTLIGKAENPNAVADLMRAMESSPWYRNVFMKSFAANDAKETSIEKSVLPRIEEKYGSFEVTADLGKIVYDAEDVSKADALNGGTP